ncbi:MAG: hypothetical protein ACLTST_11155 [Lachnospiraceae bacterium]
MKEQSLEWKPIAYIRSDFPTKFGIPRQSGLVDTTAELYLSHIAVSRK